MKTNILGAIGSTPLLKININGIGEGEIYAKAEYMNPSGSIKDRVAYYIIEEAEKKGILKRGMSIVEASSGNTGIAAAMIGLLKKYSVKIIMPENMSKERRKIIQAFNAELVLTPAEKNIIGAIEELKRIQNEKENVFILGQFINPDNWKTHYYNTAPELWEQCSNEIDIFISGFGSGGTLMGIGRFLKEKNPNIHIIALEPKNASALLGHEPGLHRIEGIGDGFVPEILDTNIIDEVIEVSDYDAIQMTKKLIKEDGLFVGISSGANIWCSIEISKRNRGKKNIITILPDRADRYYSSEIFD